MSESINIILDIEPSRSTHQSSLRVMRRKGGGFFVGKYAKSGAKKWAGQLSAMMAPYRPAKPLDGPVEVHLAWVFAHPKNTPKKRLCETVWRMKRPDLDNMEKGLLDLLTDGGFLLDDSQIVRKFSTKMDGPNPGIEIFIKPLDSEPIRR